MVSFIKTIQRMKLDVRTARRHYKSLSGDPSEEEVNKVLSKITKLFQRYWDQRFWNDLFLSSDQHVDPKYVRDPRYPPPKDNEVDSFAVLQEVNSNFIELKGHCTQLIPKNYRAIRLLRLYLEEKGVKSIEGLLNRIIFSG